MARPARGDRRQRFREESPAAVTPRPERLVSIDRARLLGASLGASLTLNLFLLVLLFR